MRYHMGLMIVAGVLSATITGAANETPYSRWQDRQIKALSAEQIDDLQAGRGMGMALPAELNGYPGPRHVLDLADKLGLTVEQLGAAQRLFEAMQARAAELGAQVIAGEAALDRLFAEETASEDSVRLAAVQLGELQGELRGHHLRYHLAARDLLSRHQLMRYQQLRGYDRAGATGHGTHGHGEMR